jgi:hypothetical protein
VAYLTGDAAVVLRVSTTAPTVLRHILVSITPIPRHGGQSVQRTFVTSSPYLFLDRPLRSIPTALYQRLKLLFQHSIGSLSTRPSYRTDLIFPFRSPPLHTRRPWRSMVRLFGCHRCRTKSDLSRRIQRKLQSHRLDHASPLSCRSLCSTRVKPLISPLPEAGEYRHLERLPKTWRR